MSIWPIDLCIFYSGFYLLKYMTFCCLFKLVISYLHFYMLRISSDLSFDAYLYINHEFFKCFIIQKKKKR